MIVRKNFFDTIRPSLFNSSLNQDQVSGCEAIILEWESRGLKDLRWLAYMLATAYHETAKTMQPVEEYGKGKGRKYGIPDPETGLIYYGRGYVQLTWKSNYATMGKLLNKPLVEAPELALKPDIAAQVMFEGMTKGYFTGVSLKNYFNDAKEDWINARKIINGLDCAEKIGGYAKAFYEALKSPVQLQEHEDKDQTKEL